jgi:hypothetical protein
LALVVHQTLMVAIQSFLQLLQLVVGEVVFKLAAIQMLVVQVAAVVIMEAKQGQLALLIKDLLADKVEQMLPLMEILAVEAVLAELDNKEIHQLVQHLHISQAAWV